MSGLNLSKFKKVSSDNAATTLKHQDGHTLKVAHDKLSKKLKSELDKLPIHAAEGADTEAPADDQELQTDEAAKKGVNININTQPQAAAPAQQMPEVAQQQAPQASLSAPVAQEQPQEAALQEVPQDNAMASAAQLASQTPEVSPQRAPASEESTPALNTAETAKNYLDYENRATEQDLANGHIKPETYHDLFAKKDTLGKIGTVFGLLLSGAGSGLTGQPNAVLKIMDNEIDRDLRAQEQSSANSQNFLKLNQQAMATQSGARLTEQQSKAMAYALTQQQMLQSSFHSLVNQVNKMPEGQQKENAKQQLGFVYNGVKEKINNINDAAAGSAAFFGSLLGGQSGSANPEEAFQKQNKVQTLLGPQGEKMSSYNAERHIPGIPGQSSIPLNPGDREAINSGVQFDQKLHRFIEWTKNHSGDLNPSDRNAGQAMAAELQGAYRQATHGGVYKEGEQNFISNIIDSNPTKFFNSVRVLPQLKAVSEENKQRVNQLLQSKGFSGYSGSQKSEAQPQYKMVNGIKYMRGPNGEAIPVK